MPDTPAPALVPTEAQAAMIARICVSLPLPPMPIKIAKTADNDDVAYTSISGKAANSHDVIGQLLLQAVLLGSQEQNAQRQKLQSHIVSSLVKEMRLIQVEQAYDVFARHTLKYIQAFVLCGTKTADEMDRLAPKADFLRADEVERDDPVHIAMCHYTASQDGLYKDVYGIGEGLDRFIEDPQEIREFERIRSDPTQMPSSKVMLKAAESYNESVSYEALIARAHDRLLREASRVEKNRQNAGMDTNDLTTDPNNEDEYENPDPPKGDEIQPAPAEQCAKVEEITEGIENVAIAAGA